MSESENASRSSAASEKRSEPRQASPSSRDNQREDLPSLHMLEESAAQLAALRQRAEYLLEQLSVGSGAAPNRENPTEDFEDRSKNSEDHGGSEPEYGPNVGFEPEGLPTFAPLQDEDAAPIEEDAAPREVDRSSAATDPAHRQTDLPAQAHTVSYQDSPHSPDSSSYSDNIGQPNQAVFPSTDADATYGQPNDDSAPHAEFQPQDYPIQNYHAQPSSLLDSPVTVARPAFWRLPESATEVGSSDAQLIEEEIISLYEAIDRVRATRRENTGHALALLREAREIISAEPQRIDRAQYNIQQAKQFIDRAKSKRSHSRNIALRTFGLLVLWLAVLGGLGAVLYLYPLRVNEFIGIVTSNTGWNTSHYYPALWTVATGGIGGCLGTISFLVERMREQEEFDRQYIIRSTIQPLMGVVLGLLLYGLLASLFGSLGASITVNPVTAYMPAALALPIGIWQVFVYAVIFRITRLLTFQRRRRW
jgi:hypothetical protein